MTEDLIREGERLDKTGFGRIQVIQRDGLGYGVDAVLLAGFAAGETGAKPIWDGAMIADLGSGSGIVSFVLMHKLPNSAAVGIERRVDAADRARRACTINGLDQRVRFAREDIKDYIPEFKFDAVVTNPPYFKRNAAIPNSGDDKFIARHETTAELADFLRIASSMLEKGGDFYMVHRPSRLPDIITEMRKAEIEPKELQLVVPHPGEAANILLIHGVKGAGAELRMLPELAIHDKNGNFTGMIQRIYERV